MADGAEEMQPMMAEDAGDMGMSMQDQEGMATEKKQQWTKEDEEAY